MYYAIYVSNATSCGTGATVGGVRSRSLGGLVRAVVLRARLEGPPRINNETFGIYDDKSNAQLPLFIQTSPMIH